MSGSPRDDAEWERVWREADDEFLTESVKDHLWQALASPQPGFNRFSQICREAHRRGKPELLMQAVQRLAPVRTASGDDLRGLLRVLEGLMSAMIQAGQAIVKISGEENAELLARMRERLKEAREAMARFASTGKDQ
ncbi:MAG TPA: hypothetical protein VKD24_05845 [Candidatus Angelobacter sp.]|nr:hypothetical protein [Candidatus Angelobacter sp.]